MNRYYVNRNAQSTGEHEVHRSGCSWLPKDENLISLGLHASCHSAVREARTRNIYSNVDGCAHCCPECHTK